MRAAVLQLSAQGLSNTKLYNYIRIASKKNIKLLLLGEYILNPFFKELKSMSINMIKDQALSQIKILKELSKTYNITIVAPLVIVKKNEVFKATIILKISLFTNEEINLLNNNHIIFSTVNINELEKSYI